MQNGFPHVPFNNVKLQNQSIKEELMEAISGVLDSDRVLDGPHRAALEQNLIARTGRKYAIPTTSGTTALGIISKAYYEPDAIVSLPAVTFVATANAFKMDGWRLHFYDNTSSIHTHLMESKLIIGVGLFGARPRSGISVRGTFHGAYVEDACQSWLAPQRNDPVQSNHTQVISFDPTKNIASLGNGGAIVTDDPKLADFAQKFINHGKDQDGDFVLAGGNHRMSELECAALNVKFKHLDSWMDRRRSVAAYYLNELSPTSYYTPVMQASQLWNHGLQKFVMEVQTGHRDSLRAFLAERNIETKIHYERTMIDHGHLFDMESPSENMRAVHESAAATMAEWISLPFYPELTPEQLYHVVKSFKEYFELNT